MSLVKYIEQRRLEKEREVRRKIRKEKLTSAAKIAAGVAVGAGKETREDIVKATKEGVGYVSENVNCAVKAVAEKAREVKEAVGEKYDNFANRNMTEISPEVDEIDVTEIAETTEE